MTPLVDATTGKPSTYEDLYLAYHRMIRSIIAKTGIPSTEQDDAVSWILVTLIEKDILAMYDPEKIHTIPDGERLSNPGPRKRPARFSSLLRRFVYLYALQYRDKIVSASRQQPVDPIDSTILASQVAPDSPEDCVERMAAKQELGTIFQALEDYPHLLRTLRVSLESPDLTRQGLAIALGVSPSTVTHHFAQVRRIVGPRHAPAE